MAFFRDEKSSLHYLVRGYGEPLLLIHGLGGSGADWAFQVAALEKRFRVIVPDLPGSGHSPPPRDEYTIDGFATTLWSLLDHLGIARTNIIGFSLGGAVALEMAARRPSSVPRLGLINSLATYRPDHWRKWLETHVSATLVRLVGMQRTASSYLGAGFALARWAIVDRLHELTGRILLIAAEHDFTPLAEKRALAATLKADIVVVRGSRHGTPFDSVEATNASLLALLTDQPLPPETRWVRDTPASARALNLAGSIAEEHALARLNAAPAITTMMKAVDRLAPV